MNGVFTEAESRHMNPTERLHYLELGLCAPVDYAGLERLLKAEREDKEYLEHQLDDANETAVSLQTTIEEQDAELTRLRYRIKDLEKVLEQTVKTT